MYLVVVSDRAAELLHSLMPKMLVPQECYSAPAKRHRLFVE
jgi:hypothetical protein